MYIQQVNIRGYGWEWRDTDCEAEVDNGCGPTTITYEQPFRFIKAIANGVNDKTKTYNPLLDTPQLFRVLAKLKMDNAQEDTCYLNNEQAILEFVSHYGLLGISDWESCRHTGRTMRILEAERAESYGRWESTIQRIKRAAFLLDTVKSKNAELARRIFEPNNPFSDKHDTLPADVILHMAEDKLVADIERWLYIHVRPSIRRDFVHAPTLDWEPRNLVGVLWLQIAQEYTGQKIHKQCEVCGEWFEVGQEASRRSRRYCGNACRCEAYRRRRKQQGEDKTQPA